MVEDEEEMVAKRKRRGVICRDRKEDDKPDRTGRQERLAEKEEEEKRDKTMRKQSF